MEKKVEATLIQQEVDLDGEESQVPTAKTEFQREEMRRSASTIGIHLADMVARKVEILEDRAEIWIR